MSNSTDQPDPATDSPMADSVSDVRSYSPFVGSQTVVNPEGRPDFSPASDQLPTVADPSVWQVLFPSGNEGDSKEFQLAGVQLEHFAIEERIRSGGMGAVFRARDIRLNRTVALKVLPPRQSLNTAAVRRFQNEAQSAAQLDHENIARAFYIGEDKGLHFIAFEFVTGTNIAELIHRNGKIPVDDALNYTLQVASALLHVSERGVVHRDIKPSNIIITTKNRAKLVDMGLARNENRDASADLTVAGTTLGTFDYISPEQAKDPRTVDVRSDIYSLGCTLYHMLTGEAPYPGGTMLQKLLDHQGKDAPDPAEKNPRITDDLSAIVRKMMASDPKRRYQTADELMRDLMLVAGTMGLRSLSPEGLVWMSSRPLSPPFWERHLPWMSTVAALVVLVVAASIYPQFTNLNQSQITETIPPNSNKSEDHPPGLADTGASPLKPASPAENPPAGVAAGSDGHAETVVTKQKTGASTPISPAEQKLTVGSPSPSSKAPSGFTLGPEPSVAGLSLNERLGRGRMGPPSVRGNNPPSEIESQLVQIGPPPFGDANRFTESESPKQDTPQPPKVASVDRDRVFIVLGVDDEADQAYRSLEAACTDAVDGGKIELRFNGVREENKPIRIQDKRIRIRAADGFHPVLLFTPADIPVSDYRTRLFTVSGGSLELANVNLVLKIDDRFSSETWALFSLDRPESIQMEHVTVTVENHDPRRSVAVFEIASSAGADFNGRQMPDDEPTKALQLDIANCMIRGGCDLLAIHRQAALRVTIDESLLALGNVGTVARVTGNMYEPREAAVFELTLNHVTTLAGGGLLRMTSDTVPHKLIPVQVTSTNNIFSSPQMRPLIAMTGKASNQEFRDLLQWTGKYNYYDRYAEFWTIDTPSSDDNLGELDFEAWQVLGTVDEVDAYNDPVSWNNPWRKSHPERLLPGDATLDQTALNNPPVKGTTSGRNAGADPSDLPTPLGDR